MVKGIGILHTKHLKKKGISISWWPFEECHIMKTKGSPIYDGGGNWSCGQKSLTSCLKDYPSSYS
jgi:hypothetical protein